jgi:endonuclease-3 related protein
MFASIYESLLRAYGPQHWWPVSGGFRPAEWEIEVGAVLAQNTAWTNAEKALRNLAGAGITSRRSLLRAEPGALAALIRPSGCFNQKARKLRTLASSGGRSSREALLSLWGIGPETADSVLLYARGKPFFVVDAYTRRLFSRLGLITGREGYDAIRSLFEQGLPKDVALYREFHALIVRHGKERCRKRPLCQGCPLESRCSHATAIRPGAAGR